MPELPLIPDDEVLLRRIPFGRPWLTEEPRITSANFSPKAHETGISVSRRSLTSPSRLRALAPNPAAFCVAATTVRQVRALGLEVFPEPTPDDPGHCEIRPVELLHRSQALRKKLARAYELLPVDVP